jgi:hypothetical protein
MPDVADYILAKPGADKLGYGSECHLGSLVFSQCWLEPKPAKPEPNKLSRPLQAHDSLGRAGIFG